MSTQLRRRSRHSGGVDLDILEGGTGPQMLYLHGGEAVDAYGTRHLEGLARHFRVIAPSHPGFGRSTQPNGLSSVDDLAYFYLDVSRELGLQKAMLAGSGFGGWTALEMAVRDETWPSKHCGSPLHVPWFRPGQGSRCETA
jgi:pimeloyl-ACP methyl ester carboxylesterase